MSKWLDKEEEKELMGTGVNGSDRITTAGEAIIRAAEDLRRQAKHYRERAEANENDAIAARRKEQALAEEIQKLESAARLAGVEPAKTHLRDEALTMAATLGKQAREEEERRVPRFEPSTPPTDRSAEWKQAIFRKPGTINRCKTGSGLDHIEIIARNPNGVAIAATLITGEEIEDGFLGTHASPYPLDSRQGHSNGGAIWTRLRKVAGLE